MALQFAVTSWANMCPGQPAAAQPPEKPGNQAETDVKNVRKKDIGAKYLLLFSPLLPSKREKKYT